MNCINIENTDIITWLQSYNGPKFHSVLSDPPYGLSFMGKEWDKYSPKEYQEWVTKWGKLLLDVLYPGAVCMFFGGTRTYHRLTSGLEDRPNSVGNVYEVNNQVYGIYKPRQHNSLHNDSGSAARFFYTAKASKKERNAGLSNGLVNNHPTVKPIKLTEYLAKLMLPPVDNSSILIPFAGSGSEAIGAMLAGWNVITLLEIDESYCQIAKNRLDYWQGEKEKQG